MILPGILCGLGLIVSLARIQKTVDVTWETDYRLWIFLCVVFFLYLAFVFVALLPIGFTKRFNQGHMDLMSFMSQHENRWVKIVYIASMVIGVLLPMVYFAGMLFHWSSGWQVMTSQYKDALIYVVSMLIGGIALQLILHLRNPDDHPWCSPLGKKLNEVNGGDARILSGSDGAGARYGRLIDHQDPVDDEDDQPMIQAH